MALLYIKKRREPIDIKPERAYKIKQRWLGIDGVEKADPTDTLDVGEWAGEYSQIASIEIPKERFEKAQKNYVDPEEEQRKEELRLIAMPIEERAKILYMFEMRWFMRSGMSEKNAPPDVIEKAQKLALAYYKENPMQPYLPEHVLEPLLVARWGEKKKRGEGILGIGRN